MEGTQGTRHLELYLPTDSPPEASRKVAPYVFGVLAALLVVAMGVLLIQRMPFSTVRKSLPGRPVVGFCGGKSGCSRSHCSSVSSCLRTMSIIYQLCRHTLARDDTPARERACGQHHAVCPVLAPRSRGHVNHLEATLGHAQSFLGGIGAVLKRRPDLLTARPAPHRRRFGVWS
jgi:hypothetical protein